MTLSQDDKATLRGAYDQLCVSYRAIDDFRAKLLGFLPLVTGGGLLFLTGSADGVAREFFFPVGIFGLVVTLGLLSYEIYGIAKCHALIKAGGDMEASLSLRTGQGQFQNRPRGVLGRINEPFPAAMAAWTYLAAFDAARWIGGALAVMVFIVGFTIILEYNRRLGADADGTDIKPSGGVDPAEPAASSPQSRLAQL